MGKILEVKNVSKKYQNKEGEVLAIQGINLKINRGEFVSIIGPSGCGKSTLLSIIAGLEEKTTGEIYIEGEKVEGVSSKIGYLLEWRSILSNTMFGLEIKRNKDKEAKSYVEELLKKYDLYEFKDKYPSELSGGMRQRVALIRTLAVKPKILLLDEAFSALDYQTRIMVTNDIYSILRKEGMTAIIVTHDISEGRFQSRHQLKYAWGTIWIQIYSNKKYGILPPTFEKLLDKSQIICYYLITN